MSSTNRNYKERKCQWEKCGKIFQVEYPYREKLYCGPACQKAAADNRRYLKSKRRKEDERSKNTN